MIVLRDEVYLYQAHVKDAEEKLVVKFGLRTRAELFCNQASCAPTLCTLSNVDLAHQLVLANSATKTHSDSLARLGLRVKNAVAAEEKLLEASKGPGEDLTDGEVAIEPPTASDHEAEDTEELPGADNDVTLSDAAASEPSFKVVDLTSGDADSAGVLNPVDSPFSSPMITLPRNDGRPVRPKQQTIRRSQIAMRRMICKVAIKVLDVRITRSELTSTGADYIRACNATWIAKRDKVYLRSMGNRLAICKLRTLSRSSAWITYHRYQDRKRLLIWIDLFTGYVIARASGSRTGQTVAENYDECVFHRFGASEAIRHDQEPCFMSDFFRSFNKIMGQRLRATTVYHPQANGTTERMVGTLTRAGKMYVKDVDQRDWDDYAERLTFALNTAQDRIRGDTPFYPLHGWDPRSTLEAMVPLGSTRRRDREPRRWRYRIQKQYQQAREQVNEILLEAIQERADRHNETVLPHKIEVGTQVWLYLDRVKEGYARKLAHMWHGPFRVLELVDEHPVRLEIAGTEYRLFPVVYVSKIKPVRQFPDRLEIRLTIQDQDRFDFDEALLPEDSWIRDLDTDEYEVEKIVDMRSGKRTRYGRTLRELLVHWRGYDEPTWVDEVDLNCGALLYDYSISDLDDHEPLDHCV
ncbi:LOW QUALITY PROTEIN: Reverse transcriptase [Phytophthora palmivora]|uniref:Reverse transcriptase n=1 Tax=Phytophthora palmivora TaxID=4796 RepID=A0A2P4XDR8_9STRA|nr:LOW QUALITY PROTEIN: Reverse transcriptase [Phytophthora palmivora]